MSDEDETDKVSIEETDEVEVEEEAQEEHAEQQEEQEEEAPEAQAEQEAQEAQEEEEDEEEEEAQHEEQQTEQQEEQQEEEEEEQEATEVAKDDSPTEEVEVPPPVPLADILRDGDSVRLKGLQSDTSMNGRLGKFRRLENEQDGGRFLVDLGTRGVVRVREANLEKVEPTRRSERLAKVKRAPAKPAKRSEKTPKKADRVKAKAAPKAQPKAAPKVTAVKKGSIKAARAAKEKTSGAAAAEKTSGQLFVVGDYRIRSDPSLEVQDSSSKWRPCHIYENYKDRHIVIWYGGNEYEGLGGKPYRLTGISPQAIFKGQLGKLLDSDGERIPTRKRPMR